MIIATLGVASYWTIRLAIADQASHGNSLSALSRATQLAPANAQYFVRMAQHQESEGLDSKAALARASSLQPADSSIWIHRGLRAEFEGDFVDAEKFLLEAARVDRQFDPRSTLANYYFRRDDPEQFWRWVREALAIGYGDLTTLFRLCWRMSNDPEVIRARALPPAPGVLRSYLSFLLAENRLDAAEPIARQLANSASTEDAAVLLDFIDHHLLQQKPQLTTASSVVPIWNSLCIRRIIPFSPVEQAASLTNGDFHIPLTSRGFDWRVPHSQDIQAIRVSPAGLRIDLSGKQPERCELLSQFAAVSPGKNCRLRATYRTSSLTAGLQWHLFDLQSGADILVASPDLSSLDWKQANVTFSARNADLARLALGYSRAPGTSRLEGWIALRDVELGCGP